jgi:SAM-dependent methyltransferase
VVSKVARLVPNSFRPPLRAVLKRYRVTRGPARGRGRALKAEAAFWERWFALPEADLERRLDPGVDDSAVLECLSRLPGEEAAVLDVGAGPLSTLGTRAAGKRVRLTAVDPLADCYDETLAKVGVTPLVRTLRCSGEELLDRFEPASFDIAFAENALDHCVDPLRVIRNMVAVVRRGGFVILNHAPDEAEHASYGSVHQWNFRAEEGRCILWRPGSKHDLAEALRGVTLHCRTEKRLDRERVVCLIERHD